MASRPKPSSFPISTVTHPESSSSSGRPPSYKSRQEYHQPHLRYALDLCRINMMGACSYGAECHRMHVAWKDLWPEEKARYPGIGRQIALRSAEHQPPRVSQPAQAVIPPETTSTVASFPSPSAPSKEQVHHQPSSPPVASTPPAPTQLTIVNFPKKKPIVNLPTTSSPPQTSTSSVPSPSMSQEPNSVPPGLGIVVNTDNVCQHHLKGICRLGKKCPRSHGAPMVPPSVRAIAATTAPPPPPLPKPIESPEETPQEVCQHFLKGICTKASKCSRPHIRRPATNTNMPIPSSIPSTNPIFIHNNFMATIVDVDDEAPDEIDFAKMSVSFRASQEGKLSSISSTIDHVIPEPLPPSEVVDIAPSPIRTPSPPPREEPLCRNFLRYRCNRYRCPFRHELPDNYDPDQPQNVPLAREILHPVETPIVSLPTKAPELPLLLCNSITIANDQDDDSDSSVSGYESCVSEQAETRKSVVKSKTVYCRNFNKGYCSKGDQCWRIHETIPDQFPRQPHRRYETDAEVLASLDRPQPVNFPLESSANWTVSDPSSSSNRYQNRPPKMICRDYLTGRCEYSFADCRHYHPTGAELAREINLASSEVCIPFLQGRCLFRLCPNKHLRYLTKVDEAPVPDLASSSVLPDSPKSSSVGSPVLQPNNDTLVRDDSSDSDLPERSRNISESRIQRSDEHIDDLMKKAIVKPVKAANPAPETIQHTVADHTKVTYAAGFRVISVVTGFESSAIILRNIPHEIEMSRVKDLCSRYGKVLSLTNSTTNAKEVHAIQILFSSAKEAGAALTGLNGTWHWGCCVSAQIPIVSDSENSGTVDDCSVQILWEAPQRTGYAGYATEEDALYAIRAACRIPIGNMLVSARQYEGIPTLGAYNVQFQYLPADFTPEQMEAFGPAEEVMLDRPNYLYFDRAAKLLQGLLEDQVQNLVYFTPAHPPHKYGEAMGWARFANPTAAQQAVNQIRGRKLFSLGPKTSPLKARYMPKVSYNITPAVFNAIEARFNELVSERQSAKGTKSFVSVLFNQFPHGKWEDVQRIFITISSEDMSALVRAKAEFEEILRGIVVRYEGRPLWDDSFNLPDGKAFLQELRSQWDRLVITVSPTKRQIELIGAIHRCKKVAHALTEYVIQLRCQQVRRISLPNPISYAFVDQTLNHLIDFYGQDTIRWDMPARELIVRGHDALFAEVEAAAKNIAYKAAEAERKRKDDERAKKLSERMEAIKRKSQAARKAWGKTKAKIHAEMRQEEAEARAEFDEGEEEVGPVEEVKSCPVCFCAPTVPITMSCGDVWCQPCLRSFLQAACETRSFPLKCLGNDGNCECPISLKLASEVVSPSQFDKILTAAYETHIYQRPNEFYHCPTPNCSQVYRTGPPDTVRQCPSCLARICAHCKINAHDGLTCEERDIRGDRGMREWEATHDVKKCPGCRALIEKVDGCNHITCSRCQTHVCWVCLDVFQKGQDVYDHMRSRHGSFY